MKTVNFRRFNILNETSEGYKEGQGVTPKAFLFRNG